MTTYSIGSISVSNGSPTIIGLSTLWLSNISSGMYIRLSNDLHYYLISSVNSNTNITISTNYSGTTISGAAYYITDGSLLISSLAATLDSPALTGTPTAPTATTGTNTTQIATTAFVINTVGTGSGSLLISNNLSDLGNVSVARLNLGLGNSALKNVGITTGTIAAGDDSRIVNSVQKTGDIMTGLLTLSGDPTSALHAVTKQYADSLIGANDAMVFKGVIDCSANPNYPTADRGWTYRVSVAGFIGGGSGVPVEIGDILICLTDGTVSGNQATVGANWTVIQSNIDGAVTLTGTQTLTNKSLTSPILTGTPSSTTASVDTNTTQIATTAFVLGQAGNLTPVINGSAIVGTSTSYARQDHVHPTDTSRAALASPTFTGTPSAPTATVGTNTTQLATTAFVLANGTTPASSTPLIDGTAAVGTSLLYARQDHVHPTDTSRAALASPAFTGIPVAPTATVGTNTTQIATTAFVLANGGGIPASVAPLIDGTAAVGTSLLYARQDHVHPTDTSRAALASPAFTGTPSAPTATAGTNTTQLATTAYATAADATVLSSAQSYALAMAIALG